MWLLYSSRSLSKWAVLRRAPVQLLTITSLQLLPFPGDAEGPPREVGMAGGRAQTLNLPHFLLEWRVPHRTLGVMSAQCRKRPGAEGRGCGGHPRTRSPAFGGPGTTLGWRGSGGPSGSSGVHHSVGKQQQPEMAL